MTRAEIGCCIGALAASLALGCGDQDSPDGSAGGFAGGAAAGALAGRTGAGGAPGVGASSGNSGGETSAGAPEQSCSAVDVEGLSVFSAGSWDPLGYPPYALEGCRLVYVAPDAGGGALHLRDLSNGDDVELEPAASQPRRPALAGGVIAWEVGELTQSQVRVRYAGDIRTLSGPFDHAGEPRAASDAVAFTAFLGPNANDDTDIYLYQVETKALTAVAAGPGQQRFADVSLQHVALTDFSEDPAGVFDESQSIADVVIVDRALGTTFTRKRDGKQAFPLLNDEGGIAYLDWGAVHPEPKFSQFGLRAGKLSNPPDIDIDVTAAPIQTDPAYVRPSLHGNHLDFVDTQGGVIGLYRYTLESGATAALTPIAGSPRLFGPVAADALTLIATPLRGQTLALTAVAR